MCIRYCLKLTRMCSVRYPNKCNKMLRNLDESGDIGMLFRNGIGYFCRRRCRVATFIHENVQAVAIDCSNCKVG